MFSKTLTLVPNMDTIINFDEQNNSGTKKVFNNFDITNRGSVDITVALDQTSVVDADNTLVVPAQSQRRIGAGTDVHLICTSSTKVEVVGVIA